MAEAEEIISKLIKQVAVEHNFVDYDLKIEPVSSGGANYTSKLYNVTIKESNNTHHLFAKVAAMGEKVRTQSPRFYYTEMFVYTKLAKTYDELYDTHNVPQENRLVFSKFYGCDPTLYEETVILENLVLKGYQSYDRFISITWDYAIASLTEMTKLHALSLAYSEYYPEDFDKVAADLKFEWDMENGPLLEYFNMVTAKAINLVHDDAKDKLKRFFEEFGSEKFMSLFKATRRSVLVHGDFRPSNLMHKILDDGTVEIKVVDLQTMQAASPVVDLLYFIFTGSDEQFRAEYYDKLIEHYYTELVASMKRLHLDPEKVYSRADFDHELKQKLPFGLSIAVFTLPIVTVASEDAPKVDEDMDMTSFSIQKTSDLYTERLNGIVNDYVKWGILK